MSEICTPDDVHHFITQTLDGVVPTESWGETAYFYNPGGRLKRGTYFATIKQKDGENDKASHLDRQGVWRLNIGLPKAEYAKLFGPPPARPAKGGVIEGPWNFTSLNMLMPHPVYGWMGWVAINNASPQSFDAIKPHIIAAHSKARIAFDKRIAKMDKN